MSNGGLPFFTCSTQPKAVFQEVEDSDEET